MKNLINKNLAVFHVRSYSFYFLGSSVSWIGNSMQFIAESWLVLQLTHQVFSVAIVLVATSLPGTVLSPLLGVYIDRFDRKWLAFWMDVFRGCVLLALPILWWTNLLQPWHIYLVILLVSIGDTMFTPAVSALIQEVVPQEYLLSANSFNSVALQIGSLMGASLAGIIIVISSAPIALLVDSFTFFFSASCILLMRRGSIRSVNSVESPSHPFKQYIAELKEGVNYIRQRQTLVVSYISMFFISSTLSVINVLITPFAKNVLHIGVQGFGYMETVFAFGSIIGNLLMPVLSKQFGRQRVMLSGLCAMGISLLLLAMASNLWSALLSYFLLGSTFAVWALYFTSVQERVANEYQGRTYATFNAFSSSLSLVIFLAMGLLASQVSLRLLYGLQASLLILVVVLTYKSLQQRTVVQQALPQTERLI